MRDDQQVAVDLERIGAHLGVRQFGLDDHFGIARGGDVDRREVLGRGLVPEPYVSSAVLSTRIVERCASAPYRNQLLRDLAEGRLVRLAIDGLPAEGDAAPMLVFHHHDRPLGPAGQWLLRRIRATA